MPIWKGVYFPNSEANECAGLHALLKLISLKRREPRTHLTSGHTETKLFGCEYTNTLRKISSDHVCTSGCASERPN